MNKNEHVCISGSLKHIIVLQKQQSGSVSTQPKLTNYLQVYTPSASHFSFVVVPSKKMCRCGIRSREKKIKKSLSRGDALWFSRRETQTLGVPFAGFLLLLPSRWLAAASPPGPRRLSCLDIVTLTVNSKQCICIMLQPDSGRMPHGEATLTGWVRGIGGGGGVGGRRASEGASSRPPATRRLIY